MISLGWLLNFFKEKSDQNFKSNVQNYPFYRQVLEIRSITMGKIVHVSKMPKIPKMGLKLPKYGI